MKERQSKCMRCAHAGIVETGYDVAGRQMQVHCDYFGRMPPEVVHCSKFHDKGMWDEEGLPEFMANAVLLDKDADGNLVQLVRVMPSADRPKRFAGHYWAKAGTAQLDRHGEVETIAKAESA